MPLSSPIPAYDSEDDTGKNINHKFFTRYKEGTAAALGFVAGVLSHVENANTERSMIILPSSRLEEWKAEYERQALQHPEVSIYYHEKTTVRYSQFNKSKLTVTTFDILAAEDAQRNDLARSQRLSDFFSVQFGFIVFHYAEEISRNRTARQAATAAKEIHWTKNGNRRYVFSAEYLSKREVRSEEDRNERRRKFRELVAAEEEESEDEAKCLPKPLPTRKKITTLSLGAGTRKRKAPEPDDSDMEEFQDNDGDSAMMLGASDQLDVNASSSEAL